MSDEAIAPPPTPSLKERIRARWPDIDEAELDAAMNDVEQLAALIARLTERSKAAVSRQLDELSESAKASTDASAARLEETLRRLEARADQLSEHLKKDLVPKAEEKVKENLLVSLLVALGLGFLLGLLVGVGAGRAR